MEGNAPGWSTCSAGRWLEHRWWGPGLAGTGELNKPHCPSDSAACSPFRSLLSAWPQGTPRSQCPRSCPGAFNSRLLHPLSSPSRAGAAHSGERPAALLGPRAAAGVERGDRRPALSQPVPGPAAAWGPHVCTGMMCAFHVLGARVCRHTSARGSPSVCTRTHTAPRSTGKPGH